MNFIIYSNTYTRNYPFNFYNYVGICTINEAIKIFLNNLLYNIYILKITCTHNNILCTLIHLIYLWTLLRAFILFRIFCFMIIQTYIIMLFMIKFFFITRKNKLERWPSNEVKTLICHIFIW